MRVLFWIFNLKFELKALLVFRFQTSSVMGKKGIRVRYTELMTFLKIF